MAATATFSVKSIVFPKGTFHGRKAHRVTTTFSGTHGGGDVAVTAANCGLTTLDGICLLAVTAGAAEILGGFYDAENGELILIGAAGARLGAVDITGDAALWLAIGD
jgi:hypothetical protein